MGHSKNGDEGGKVPLWAQALNAVGAGALKALDAGVPGFQQARGALDSMSPRGKSGLDATRPPDASVSKGGQPPAPAPAGPKPTQLTQAASPASSKPANKEQEQKQVGVLMHDRGTSPLPTDTHADAIRSDGEQVGFFNDKSLLLLDGQVRDSEDLAKNRPQYVDAEVAREQGLTQTLCTTPVDEEQAQAFDAYWDDMAENPPAYNFAGGNCASRIEDALVDAGIIDRSKRFETPESLVKLMEEAGATCETGFHETYTDDDGETRHRVLTEEQMADRDASQRRRDAERMELKELEDKPRGPHNSMIG